MFENLTVYQSFCQVAKECPKQMAIYYRGNKISYKRLLALVDRQADILHHTLHINKGDIILVSQPNIPDTIILFYALNKIGAVVNMVHPLTPFNQLLSIFYKTKSKYAFLFEQRVAKEVEKYREISEKIFITRIENYLPKMSKLFYHVFMNFKIRKKLGKQGDFNGFNYVHELQPTYEGIIPVDFEERTTVILHSGSTTGDPKSICLSDRPFNYIAGNADFFVGTSLENLQGLVMLSVLPSFHGFGLEMTMHLPLVTKMGIALIPKFTPKEVTKALNETHFKLVCGVPTMYEKLFRDEKFINHKYFKDLKCFFCGGDAINVNSKARINKIFEEKGANCKIYEGYGLTEALAVNCLNTPNFYKEGSIGKPMPGCVFKIFGPDLRELEPNEIGEIAFKSEAIMLEYFNDEESTKKTIRDGWLFTGDYGYVDEEGYVFFKSRMKRVVKVSGVAVFPSEVEHLIESIPEVKQVACIGVPDATLQSVLKVYIVTDSIDTEELRRKTMETCRRYLIRWSVPKHIEFINCLPVTKLGKVDYRELERLSAEN